jgi:hypothetical protein
MLGERPLTPARARAALADLRRRVVHVVVARRG